MRPALIGSFTVAVRVSDGCNVAWATMIVAAACSTPVTIDSFSVTDTLNTVDVGGSAWNGTGFTPVLVTAYISENPSAAPLLNINWTVVDASGAVLPPAAVAVQPGTTGPFGVVITPRTSGVHRVHLSFDDGCTEAFSSTPLVVYCGQPPSVVVTGAPALQDIQPTGVAMTLSTSPAATAAEVASWVNVTAWAGIYWYAFDAGRGFFSQATFDARGSISSLGNPLVYSWTILESASASYDANGGLASAAIGPEVTYAGALAISAGGGTATIAATKPGVRRVLVSVSDGCTTTTTQVLAAFLCTPPGPTVVVSSAPTQPLSWSWTTLSFPSFTLDASLSADSIGVRVFEQGTTAAVSWVVIPPLGPKSTMTGPAYSPTFTLREGGSWQFVAVVSDGCLARNASVTVTAPCPDTGLTDISPANSLASPLTQTSLFQGGRFDPIVLGSLVRDDWRGGVGGAYFSTCSCNPPPPLDFEQAGKCV